MNSGAIGRKRAAWATERRRSTARQVAVMVFFASANLIGADLGHPLAAFLAQAALVLVLLVALAVAAD